MTCRCGAPTFPWMDRLPDRKEALPCSSHRLGGSQSALPASGKELSVLTARIPALRAGSSDSARAARDPATLMAARYGYEDRSIDFLASSGDSGLQRLQFDAK